MKSPADVTTFLAIGVIELKGHNGEKDEVITKFHSGIFFIGWRCLYAEIQASRADERPINLEKNLKRTISMAISRLKGYGMKWKTWVDQGTYHSPPRIIHPSCSSREGQNTTYTFGTR